MSGLYVHIPFCKRRCIYCDFYSLGSRNAPWESYVDALLCEFRVRKGELGDCLTTLYIGGGTPSQMPVESLRRLVEGLRAECGDLWAVEEFTVEVNPDDVVEGYGEFLCGLGVNRVSMGVQSFVDSELKVIGRRHSAEDAVGAFGRLATVGNRSLDLIFGLPGQTLSSWIYSVDRLVDLRPNHVSVYSLMYEEGSVIYKMCEQGRVCEAEEGLSECMFREMVSRLRGAGYVQYEISNFSLPGFESRHNLGYWSGGVYLGLGVSAHSYDGGRVRRSNPAVLSDYIDFYSGGLCSDRGVFYECEFLGDVELYDEYVMTRLRRMEGVNLSEFRAVFGEESYDYLMRNARRHLEGGRLVVDEGRLCLSDSGVLVSDSVFCDLMWG